MLICVTSGDGVRAGHLWLDEFGVQNPFPEGGDYTSARSPGCRLDLCSDVHLQPLRPDLVTALGNAEGSSRGSLAAMLGSRTVASDLPKASEGLCRQMYN